VNKRIQQRGFTLIELVVVITILGILAAFAIPRFASLEGQARLAAVQGLAGSLRSGAALAHAMWLAQGGTGAVTMEGQTINMTFGYPNVGTIQLTIADVTGFAMTNAGGGRRFTKTSAAGTPIAGCYVTYTAALANGAPQVVVNPALTTTC
jgi:MSHA pilin protein MshA